MTARRPGVGPGRPVVAYLQSPREKVWGVILSLAAAGVVLRGLELGLFEDWVRQEARGDEPLVGPTTAFYPLHRVERLELDEPTPLGPGMAGLVEARTGRAVGVVLGLGASRGYRAPKAKSLRGPRGARKVGASR
jgi:hypothetical protein